MLCAVSKALYYYPKIFVLLLGFFLIIYVKTCNDIIVLHMILWSMAQPWPGEEGERSCTTGEQDGAEDW